MGANGRLRWPNKELNKNRIRQKNVFQLNNVTIKRNETDQIYSLNAKKDSGITESWQIPRKQSASETKGCPWKFTHWYGNTILLITLLQKDY